MPKFVKKYTETQYFRRGFLRRLHARYSLYNIEPDTGTDTGTDTDSDTYSESKEKKKSKHG